MHSELFGPHVERVTQEIWILAFLIVQSHCFEVRF